MTLPFGTPAPTTATNSSPSSQTLPPPSAPAATTAEATTDIAFFTTTVAASLPDKFPFAGYELAIRPVLSVTDDRNNVTANNPITQEMLDAATKSLVDRIVNDSSVFATAFRADLGSYVGVPAGDIAVAAVVSDPKDPTGFTLIVRFKIALVRRDMIQMKLLALLPNSSSSNSSGSGGSPNSGSSTAATGVLPHAWSPSMLRVMNQMVDSNSTGISVVGVDALWASPDATQITGVPSGRAGAGSCAEASNAFCFLECDCAGSIMTLLSIVITLIFLGISIWQHYEMKKWTQKEDREHAAMVKEVEARDEVREKLGYTAATAANAAAAPAAASSERNQSCEQEMKPVLVAPAPPPQTPPQNYNPRAAQYQPQQPQHNNSSLPPNAGGMYADDFLL